MLFNDALSREICNVVNMRVATQILYFWPMYTLLYTYVYGVNIQGSFRKAQAPPGEP